MRDGPGKSVLLSLAASGVLGACSSTLEPPSGDPLVDLRHPDPRIRAVASKEAVDRQCEGCVPLLIENLDHGDATVRFYSVIALRKLTGNEFGFLPYGAQGERDDAAKRWRDWAAVGLDGR